MGIPLIAIYMKKVHYNRIKAVLAQSTVSHWCTNEMQPSIETLFRIAGYLKMEARDLLVLMKEGVRP